MTTIIGTFQIAGGTTHTVRRHERSGERVWYTSTTHWDDEIAKVYRHDQFSPWLISIGNGGSHQSATTAEVARAMAIIAADMDAFLTPTPEKPGGRMKLFKFDVGNSNEGPIGYCATIRASTPEEALATLQDLLPEELDLSISDDYDPAIYARVYINHWGVTIDDITEWEYADDEEEELT
jgi:hypothetical protein